MSEVGLDGLSVAVAHWHVNSWGGAEYLVTNLAKALDVPCVYTLDDPTPADPNPYGDIEFEDVLESLSPAPLRRIQARANRVFEYALWEDVDWRDYGDPDVLVTSGATTRAVITPDDTLHVNYCHSPSRWFYDLYHDRKETATGVLARPLVRHLRTRDAAVDPRVDHYFANSPIVARRVWKYYKRDSEVLYPPIDVERYRNSCDEGFYLHLGRLDEEKGVPAVVGAFADLNVPLVLAGEKGDISASVRRTIERTGNLEYRGFVSEAQKADLLATCRALVFNGRNEDFGIVPIEALASGKPVLARSEGFPARVVTPGETGILHDGSEAGIRDAVERFERQGISGDPRRRALEFSLDSFEKSLVGSIRAAYETFQRF